MLAYNWHSCLIVLHVQEPRIPIPNLDFGGAVLSPILPHASGFQILTTPITAIGIGKIVWRLELERTKDSFMCVSVCNN